MRETRPYGSEGGESGINPTPLPLYGIDSNPCSDWRTSTAADVSGPHGPGTISI
jgi:hypothetical protein